MKRRWLLLLVAAAALSVGLGAAAPASAIPGKGAATPFKASYGPLPDFYTYAHFDCSGAHIVNPNMGMVKDSETCLLTGDTSDLVAGTYSGDPWITLPWVTFPTQWSSDYDGALATHATQTFVDNGDGTWTMYVVAYY